VSTTTTDRGPGTGPPPAVDAPRAGRAGEDRDEDLARLPDPPIILLPGAADVDADAEPVLHIEPRLRARRVEIRRAARRHRRRVAMGVTSLLLLLGAAAGALYSPLLDVDHIRVAGAYHLGAGEVARVSGLRRGDRLFDLDPARAAAKVEGIPWVRDARVERRWPDGVVIRVTERTPVATVATSSGTKRVITTGGVVAGRATGFDVALPTVSLETGVPKVGSHLAPAVADAVEMVGALPGTVKRMMTGATVTATGDVTVQLAPSGEIRFGRAEQVSEKYLAAETLLGGAVQLQRLCRVDVRIPSAPTLSRSC
jgi:cell division protein FtsQ